jgi:hypothetical protein
MWKEAAEEYHEESQSVYLVIRPRFETYLLNTSYKALWFILATLQTRYLAIQYGASDT